MTAQPSRIILPGLTAEEENSKKLAVELLQTAERSLYTNREILGACAVFAACTIKARYQVSDWEKEFKAFVGMAANVLGQF